MNLSRLAVLALGVSLTACAGVPSESFDFRAPTFTSAQDFWNDRSSGDVTVRGQLSLPQGAIGPVPVVVLAHASGGVTADVPAVAAQLNQAGFATLYYDSFATRGISGVAQGGALLAAANQVADAYAALGRLSQDARIDVRRSAILGMSVGGGAAVAAGTEGLRARALGADGPRFAAHVAFYPGLHMAPSARALGPAPVLIVLGGEDDYQKPARPRAWTAYVQREAPGASVRLVELPTGTHSFLLPGLSRRLIPEYANASLCPLLLIAPGPPRYLTADGEIIGSMRCSPTRGGTLGGDPQAARQGMQAAIAFLREAFAAAR